MTKQEFIDNLMNTSFLKEWKDKLLEKISNLDEVWFQNFLVKFQEKINNLDDLYNDVYSLTIKYKDTLKIKVREEVNTMRQSIEKIHRQEEEKECEEILDWLDNL